jgi:hypothetical protein
MKNPDSLQASSGFKQTAFLLKSGFTPKSCHRFINCNVPICPLDADWQKRVLHSDDPTCFLLTESVKDNSKEAFEHAGAAELYKVVVRDTHNIIAKHPRIRIALERAKLTGSRMTNRVPNRGEP